MKLAAMALVGLAFLALGVLRITPAGPAHQSPNAPQQADEFLPLVEGRNTNEDVAFKRLFGSYGSGRDLRHLSAIGDVRISEGVEPPMPLFSPNARPEYPSPELVDMACRADAVVVGVLGNGSAHLTEKNDFIFSVYTFTVAHVMKQNTSLSIQPSGDITVVRSGGSTKINGHVVRAVDPFFPGLTRGQRYLLFLRSVPGTSAGQATDEGSFLIGDGKLTRMTRKSLYDGRQSRSISERALLAELRDAVNASCKTSTSGGAGR